MAYDGYRTSFDPPGFNPSAGASNSYASNNGASSSNSSSNINNIKQPNAPYPGYLQPSYGEYPVEQDPSSHPPHPPPPPPPQQQQQQQQQQVPYAPKSAAPVQGTEYTEQPAYYPPPVGPPLPPQAGDALKQPFSPTASHQEPPTPRVPDPGYPSTDLIAQVTAAVIQQLRVSNPGNPPPLPTHPSQQSTYQPPTPALSQSSYNRQSPNPSSLSPPITTSPYGPPPSSIPGQPGFSNAPSQSSYPPISSRVDGNPYATGTQAQNPTDTTPQPPTSPGVNRARGSSLGSFNDGWNGGNRPKGPSSHATATAESTHEKAWGILFDADDLPTSRMGQLLRGVALHMVC